MYTYSNLHIHAYIVHYKILCAKYSEGTQTDHTTCTCTYRCMYSCAYSPIPPNTTVLTYFPSGCKTSPLGLPTPQAKVLRNYQSSLYQSSTRPGPSTSPPPGQAPLPVPHQARPLYQSSTRPGPSTSPSPGQAPLPVSQDPLSH